MNKKMILALACLIVLISAQTQAWRGRGGYYGGYRHDGRGAAIAGGVLGGLSLIGAGIATSEARKTRRENEEYEERIAQLEAQLDEPEYGTYDYDDTDMQYSDKEE